MLPQHSLEVRTVFEHSGVESRCDPPHHDGGPSFLHMGLTLWGRDRTLVFHRTSGSDLRMTANAGHIYFGSICGPEHAVEHSGQEAELLVDERLGGLEIVLLVRSACFQLTRGSKQPNPKELFSAAVNAVLPLLLSKTWRLPSFGECQSCLR